ncbi:MAG: GntR family transcriptional regulator [Pseudomonadota bacterium]
MKSSVRDKKAMLLAHLKRAIMTLELSPGEDLDEMRLAEQFGLSRTPLREVFRQLAQDGCVSLRENRGARVSDMSYASLRDFFQAAPMIYGAVLRLAAMNSKPEQIEDLIDAQDGFKTALHQGSGVDRALANHRFHEITGEMAGNRYLLPSFRMLLVDHARISMTFFRPRDAQMAARVSEASVHHDQIIAAIRAGDEAARCLA